MHIRRFKSYSKWTNKAERIALIEQLQAYRQEHGHLIEPLMRNHAPELALQLRDLLSRRKHLASSFRKSLVRLGVLFKTSEKDWFEQFALLQSYKTKTGTLYCENDMPELYNWLTFQRYMQSLGQLKNHQEAYLRRLGVSFAICRPEDDEHFENRYLQLTAFKHCYGDIEVPYNYELAPSLHGWLRETKKLKLELPPERVEKLSRMGLKWE